jgi:hypothetical protein
MLLRVAGAQGSASRGLNHVQTDAFNRQNRTIGISEISLPGLTGHVADKAEST